MNTFQTADLYDTYGDSLQVTLPIFLSFGLKTKFNGKIVTVKCHEDNSRVAELTSSPGNGFVMVVDGGGSLRCALLGDNLALKALENGWEGIIVFGCIRDSAIINKLNIGIKALQTNPAKSVKRGTGLINEPVQFAETRFTPGDYLYADEDGILVSKTRLGGEVNPS